MTETQQKQRAHVQPSSRDPITHWLDVFTKLLAVPPAERLRIRDELEDHLRMRVDDLLILGMTEPEAVQKAVTELGETAELAKRFKEARTSTRRRIFMHTALFAVAGAALTFSIIGLNPQANRVASPAQSQGNIAVQPEDADISSHPKLEFDLDAGPLNAVLAQLAEAAGTRLFVHWGSLEQAGVHSESEVAAIPSDGLDMDKVQRLLNSALGLEGLDQITGSFEDGLMEIGTQRYFDMQSIITLDHDVSELVPACHILEQTGEAENLRDSIIDVIEHYEWAETGGNNAITILGSHLSVRAPERVQVQVIDFIARLRHTDKLKQTQRDIAKEEEKIQSANRVQQLIERLELSKRNAARELAELEAELPELNRVYWASEYEIKDVETAYRGNEDHDGREEQRAMLVELRTRLDSVADRRESVKEDIQRLRMRISKFDEDQLSYSMHSGR